MMLDDVGFDDGKTKLVYPVGARRSELLAKAGVQQDRASDIIYFEVGGVRNRASERWEIDRRYAVYAPINSNGDADPHYKLQGIFNEHKANRLIRKARPGWLTRARRFFGGKRT